MYSSLKTSPNSHLKAIQLSCTRVIDFGLFFFASEGPLDLTTSAYEIEYESLHTCPIYTVDPKQKDYFCSFELWLVL